MEEKHQARNRAILVHIDFSRFQEQADINELIELVESAGIEPVTVISGERASPDPKYFVGHGKAEEIKTAVLLESCSLVIFNHSLTPSQERSLEDLVKARVLDRTGLILDIFAQRARTFEGKLQVELAQLQHLATRLVRGWSHLERQKGGIGLRGPGETQLETDRRLLRARIKQIHKQLAKVRKQREQNRRARRRTHIPVVAIVGYTNAGKSTLFNALTQADVYTADKLFATLDPTLRKVHLPDGNDVILADTVGFIRHLPHDLIEAFRATLEETKEADLLLHVIDVNHDEKQMVIEEVGHVLEAIGAFHIPTITVYNKIDANADTNVPKSETIENRVSKIWCSAKEKIGLDQLKWAISQHLFGDPVYRLLVLGPELGKLRSELYQKGVVLQEQVDEEGSWLIHVRMAKKDYEIIEKMLSDSVSN